MKKMEAQTGQIELSGEQLTYRLRTSARARRITLRLAPRDGSLQVTVPRGVTQRQVVAFLESQSGWIARRRAALPDPIPFTEGTSLPLIGQTHCIRHCPDARRGVWLEEGYLNVSGPHAHLPRRVEDFLRRHAREQLGERARRLNGQLPPQARPLGRVSVRDTTSRWGSCTADGNLSFSWRLVFAPEQVFDYVVAHEVAHLMYLDHSRAFWQLVARLQDDIEAPRVWLRREGNSLLRYGARA